MKQTIVILTLFLVSCSENCIEKDNETCEDEQRQSTTHTIEKSRSHSDRTFESRSINTVSRKLCVREKEEQSYCFD